MIPTRPIELSETKASAATKLQFRVRYAECDPMNVAHHSAYPVWLEMARTELLRGQGVVYCDLEQKGTRFVVVELSIRYRRPAFYDDELEIQVHLSSATAVRINHAYTICCGSDLLATATTTLVCVDRKGRPQRIPMGLG